jgi:hypothetical protein
MLGPAMKPTPVQLRRWRSSVSESGRLALALAVSTGLAVVVVLLLLRDGGFPTPTNAESPQPIPGPTARASLPRVDPYRRDGAGQACEVLVQNGEGAPVLGCVVLVWRRNHAGLAQATTDAAGRATFETQGGAGGFWLPAWEMAPVFVSVPELSGGHTHGHHRTWGDVLLCRPRPWVARPAVAAGDSLAVASRRRTGVITPTVVVGFGSPQSRGAHRLASHRAWFGRVGRQWTTCRWLGDRSQRPHG